MIAIINDTIQRTLIHLDSKYGRTDKTVYVHIIEDCDSIEDPNGNAGFGVFAYDREDDHPDIYVAADVPEPEKNVPYSLAHEYMHFLQWCDGRPFDEEEAERFADRVMIELGICQRTEER